MALPSELPVPAPVLQAERSMELIRVWIADGDPVVVVSPNMWKDPGAWGILLVDLARHVAVAYSKRGIDEGAARAKIREAFQAEWDHPTH